VDKIIKEKEQKESELFETRNTSKHEMWLKELDKLRNLYISYKQERTLIMNGEKDTEKMKIKAKKIVKQKKT
jgi:hypothetical protein